jgi:hypothetical protein
MKHILIFIPMCLVILVLFDLLFTYRNPGPKAILFFRALFLLFLITFLILGAILSAITRTLSDPEASLTIWSASTDIVLAVFFAMPARSLLEAVADPSNRSEDFLCVNFCKVGIVLYVLLFAGRAIWSITYFWNLNLVQSWVNKHVLADGTPDGRARAINCAFDIVFDFVPAVLSMVTVTLIQNHKILFRENPYFSSVIRGGD